MAGKEIENRGATSLDELKAKVQQKYTGQIFEHPHGYGYFEVARLKRSEREEINNRCRRADGSWDSMLQNRMAAAFGMVSPRLSVEQLAEYPDDFIEGIAEEVWRLSNDYRDDATKGDGIKELSPFQKVSSGASVLPPS